MSIKEEIDPYDVATIAMYIKQGFDDVDKEHHGQPLYLYADPDQGHISFYSDFAAWAVITEKLVMSLEVEEYPGVFEYEVCEPFGTWYGNYILQCGKVPEAWLARETMTFMIADFFAQGSEARGLAIKYMTQIMNKVRLISCP